MSDEENVKVAVRVRPFNKREKERNASLIVSMSGSSTTITDPNGTDEPRVFTFDYSYWSHDGCKERDNGFFAPDTSHENGSKYSDQNQVFDDLGRGVLHNAWEGYNTTLFAYGQTGSGKSWSIVGYGANKGVVPLLCEELFKGITEKRGSGDKTEFEVTFSMLEIYNEQVRDLLDSRPKARGGLKVRQHPKQGFYAENLQVKPVGSYNEIESRIDEGTTNRTVASTNMNATSSRAHTVVAITFIQKFTNAAGEDRTKSSLVNLVDLAGSERADSTGATGDRLKEGAAINQSLSCLGNCISALADRSCGKQTRVPFRDSVLTKLLKNALGGNSKTIMIAAISPADINYDESVSTLRYADRAKQIKTKASVNEDPTEKLIRELQEENEKLKKMIESGNFADIVGDNDDPNDAMTQEERDKIKSELSAEYDSMLEHNRLKMEEMEKTFAERLTEAGTGASTHNEIIEKKKTVPHMYNLNIDTMLTGHICFFMDTPKNIIGRNKKDSKATIQLGGPSIAEKHAIITEKDSLYQLETGEQNARLLRNGKAVTALTDLKHNDRLLFGTTQFFVFVNPKERDAAKQQYSEVTFEMAQEEIARKSGFDVSSENKSRDEILLKQDLLELMPMIEEVNSLSEEMDKKMKFELIFVSPEARGELKGRTEVMIRVYHLETKHEWTWSREKFLNRKYLMQEMYENYVDGESCDLPPEKDPFVDDYKSETHIGSVKVWLRSLAYLIETKEQLEVTDFKGNSVGLLNIEILPCNNKGKELSDADIEFIDDPNLLIGRNLDVLVKVISARGLPNRFTEIYAKYLFYMDEKYTETKKVKDTTNPDWNCSTHVKHAKVTEQMVDYLQEGALMVQIWGKQKPPKKKRHVDTKAAMAVGHGQVSAANTNTKKFDADKVKYMMLVSFLRKKQEKMDLKLKYYKDLVELLTDHKHAKVSNHLICDLYNAQTADQADKCLKLVKEEFEKDAKTGNKMDESGDKTRNKGDKKDDSSSSDSSSSDDENEDKEEKRKKKKESPKSSPSKDKKSSTCVLL